MKTTTYLCIIIALLVFVVGQGLLLGSLVVAGYYGYKVLILGTGSINALMISVGLVVISYYARRQLMVYNALFLDNAMKPSNSDIGDKINVLKRQYRRKKGN
jgi:hypothetical protein